MSYEQTPSQLPFLDLGYTPMIENAQKALHEQKGENIAISNWSPKPDQIHVTFKIALSQNHLIFDFHVFEPMILAQHTQPQSMVCEDSCVEVFFKIDDEEQTDYFNLETNPIGTIHCFKGPNRHDRIPLERIHHIQTKPSLGREPFDTMTSTRSWSILILAPLSLFYTSYEEVIQKGLKANFYKCGDKLPQPHYLSWAPIHTPAPDFHQPNYFKPLSFFNEAIPCS